MAGFIPSKVMLYDANCKPVYDFGSGPYNIIRWNPLGRFLVVCGFGNLPGGWGYEEEGRVRVGPDHGRVLGRVGLGSLPWARRGWWEGVWGREGRAGRGALLV